MKKQPTIAQYLETKPHRQAFHGEAPAEMINQLDKIQRELKAKSRNQIMLAAFRLLIETHEKKTE